MRELQQIRAHGSGLMVVQTNDLRQSGPCTASTRSTDTRAFSIAIEPTNPEACTALGLHRVARRRLKAGKRFRAVSLP